MAGPQMLQQGGNSGIASIQQGLASIQQLGQFLEQKRQFDEDQSRLNRMQDANWGTAMLNEVIKTTGAQSIKDVARDYPTLLSMIFQKGLGVDEGTVMPWITAFASSPYNASESYNEAMTILHQYGSGDVTGQQALEQSISKTTKATVPATAAGTKTPPAAPTAATTVPSPFVPPKAEGYKPIPEAKPASGQVDPVERLKSMIAQDVQGGNMYAVPAAYGPMVRDFVKTLDATDAKKVADWATVQMPSFLENEAKTFTAPASTPEYRPPEGTGSFPPVKPAVAPVSAPSTVSKPEEDIPTLKRFAQSLIDAGATFQAPADQLSEATLKKLPADNPNTWNSFLGGKVVSPSPTTPASTATPEEAATIGSSVTDLFSLISSKTGAGKVKQAQKRLEKALTPVMVRQLEESPKGIRSLVANASAIVNDPDVMRAMALQQNAPAVYQTDLAASGQTAASQIEIAKGLKDLEKLGYDTETAKAKMLEAGLTNMKLQNELIMSSVVMTLIQSGNFVPSELASQVSGLQEKMQTALGDVQKAKTANKPAEMDAALSTYNTLKEQWGNMMLSVKNAVGKADTPEAQKLRDLISTTLKFQPGRFLFWNRGNVSKGQLVAGASAAATAKPTLSKDATGLASQYGLGP